MINGRTRIARLGGGEGPAQMNSGLTQDARQSTTVTSKITESATAMSASRGRVGLDVVQQGDDGHNVLRQLVRVGRNASH